MKRGPYKIAPPEGTVAALARAFQTSPRYLGWSASTRVANDRKLAAFVKFNGDRRVSDLRRGDFLRLRDSLSETPGAAQNWMKVINAIMDYAVDLEWIETNPARSIPRLALRDGDGHRTWREDEIDAFLGYHRPGTVAHTAMTLMLYTGASIADAVLLGPQNVRDGRLSYRRVKTAKRGGPMIDIPILPPLAEMIEALPKRMTFLETERGASRSSKSLTGDMARWTVAAGLGRLDEAGRALTCHGLRKAMARRLAEAGVKPQAIMAWLGHKSIAQAAHYSASYDRARAADSAAELLANISPMNKVVTRLKKPKHINVAGDPGWAPDSDDK